MNDDIGSNSNGFFKEDGGILESILEVGILRQALASTHPVEPGSGQFVSVF